MHLFNMHLCNMHVFNYAASYGGVDFLCFRLEIPFLSKFVSKNQNCQFKLKFSTRTDSNMQDSLVMFTFSVFNWIYFVGRKKIWSKKIKIVSLN